jgi:hypothetical protein
MVDYSVRNGEQREWTTRGSLHTRMWVAGGHRGRQPTSSTGNPLAVWEGSGWASGASSSSTRRYERHEDVRGTRSCTGHLVFFSLNRRRALAHAVRIPHGVRTPQLGFPPFIIVGRRGDVEKRFGRGSDVLARKWFMCPLSNPFLPASLGEDAIRV